MRQPKIDFEKIEDVDKNFPLDTDLEDSMFPEPEININLGAMELSSGHEEIKETLERVIRLYYKNYYVCIIGVYATSEKLRGMEESFKNTLLSGLSPYLKGRDFNVKVVCEPFRKETNHHWSNEIKFDINIEVN